MRGPDEVRKMQKPLRVGEVSGVRLLAPQAQRVDQDDYRVILLLYLYIYGQDYKVIFIKLAQLAV